MNVVFFLIVAGAFAVAGWREVFSPADHGTTAAPMQALASAVIDSAGQAVELAIGLVGVMTLFLGLMKVAEAGGMLIIIAGLLRPLMQRLFPDVPPDHPAMGAMILNMSANVLGLGNAATPFGIRAMQELDRLNPVKGTASNPMVLLLAINTASVTVLPTGVIALRAAAGSADPAGILPTTLFATICSTAFAILLCKLCERVWPMSADATTKARHQEEPLASISADEPSHLSDPTDASAALTLPEPATCKSYPIWASVLALAAVLGLVPLSLLYGRQMAPWLIPSLVIGLLSFGVVKRVRVYEVLVDGAREGFQVAVRIIPYLVAILVAVGMFRASGALDILARTIGVVSGPLGLPAEAVPMALIRSLSGSGAFGVLASLINDPAIGPDSYTGYLVSTIQGSSDTTLYIIAVYFGAVGVRRIRHAVFVGLSADVCAVATSVFICSRLYGG